MIIRPLTETDVPAYQALRLRGLCEEPVAFGASAEEAALESPAAIIAHWQDSAKTPGNFVLGAFLADNLVGIVGLTREKKAKLRHRALLWGMYVAPEAQGRGIARALIADLVARAKAVEDLEQIHLNVTSVMTVARSVYLRLGFEICGHERQAMKLADRYYDCEQMVFWLREQAG
ncbi:MAG: GNAT family N-acetyltransferase [Candidatus Sericytochromatia bacterium]|nr:GNAT family N-acetyltransferase [Candidatus Sericytochromatia bacterium]